MRYAGFEKIYKAELNDIRNQGISQGREEGKAEVALVPDPMKKSGKALKSIK